MFRTGAKKRGQKGAEGDAAWGRMTADAESMSFGAWIETADATSMSMSMDGIAADIDVTIDEAATYQGDVEVESAKFCGKSGKTGKHNSGGKSGKKNKDPTGKHKSGGKSGKKNKDPCEGKGSKGCKGKGGKGGKGEKGKGKKGKCDDDKKKKGIWQGRGFRPAVSSSALGVLEDESLPENGIGGGAGFSDVDSSYATSEIGSNMTDLVAEDALSATEVIENYVNAATATGSSGGTTIAGLALAAYLARRGR